MNQLEVACRKPGCAWHGTYGDYCTHRCPLLVDNISDMRSLQELMYFDERLDMKLEILRVIGGKIINPRTSDVNEDNLMLILAYMARYVGFPEIGGVCLDIVLQVAENAKGFMCISKFRGDICHVLHEMRGFNELSERAMQLDRKMRESMGVEAAELLIKRFRVDDIKNSKRE